MRHAVDIAPFGPFADPRLLQRLARVAEDAGWDAVHLWDHVNWPYGAPVPTADAWIAAAAVMAVTERVQVGTAVTPLPRRLPHEVARQATTLHTLGGGRFVLGVGSGGGGEFDAAEYAAFGLPTDARDRAARLDEGLEVVTALWSGEPVHHRGPTYTVDGVTFLPASPDIPVWVGGIWGKPRPLRRAARWDAYLPVRDDGRPWGPEDVVAARERLAAEATGRRTALVLTGSSRRDGQADRLADLDAAGLDWWSESVYERDGDPEDVLRRVARGPVGR